MKLTKIVLFLLVFSITTLAQLRAVEKAEFDKVGEAEALTRKTSRIVKREVSEYRDGNVSKVTTEVSEYVIPNRTHITVAEKENGITKVIRETIHIEGRNFKRDSDGKWSEIRPVSGGFGGGGSSIDSLPIKSVTQFAVGEVILNGESVTLYSDYKVYGLALSLLFRGDLTYVNSKGLVVRELKRSSRGNPETFTRIEELTYSYQTEHLVIEIPVVAVDP